MPVLDEEDVSDALPEHWQPSGPPSNDEAETLHNELFEMETNDLEEPALLHPIGRLLF